MSLSTQWLSTGVLPCLAGIRMSPKEEKPKISIVRSILLVNLVVQMCSTNIQNAFNKNAENRMWERTLLPLRVLQTGWIGSFRFIRIIGNEMINKLKRYSWCTKFISCASDTINLNQQTLFQNIQRNLRIQLKATVLGSPRRCWNLYDEFDWGAMSAMYKGTFNSLIKRPTLVNTHVPKDHQYIISCF